MYYTQSTVHTTYSFNSISKDFVLFWILHLTCMSAYANARFCKQNTNIYQMDMFISLHGFQNQNILKAEL